MKLELAGVMAHEMSHVYMQHSAKQASKQSNGPQGILGVLGRGAGRRRCGQSGTDWELGIGAGTIFLKYSRDDEAQADAVGAIIMYKAGYNPQAMADFFQKLEKQAGPGGPQFLSDHPNPGNRVEAVDKEIASWPPKQYVAASPAFQQVKQQAKGIKAYNAEQIGAGAKTGQWAQQNQQTGAVLRDVAAAGGVSATSAGTLSNEGDPSKSLPAANSKRSREIVSVFRIRQIGKLGPGRIRPQ